MLQPGPDHWLLRLADDGGSVCAEAKALTLGRLNDVGREIADLRKLEQALRYMVAQFDEGGTRS